MITQFNRAWSVVPAYFEDIQVGQVVSLGLTVVDSRSMQSFCAIFAPNWNKADGAPEAFTFAVWARMDAESAATWPQTKRLGVDALRWMRNPPEGEVLRGRMTILAKDPVGDSKGIVIAQHDVLDEAGRLVFSCLTRSLFSSRSREPQ